MTDSCMFFFTWFGHRVHTSCYMQIIEKTHNYSTETLQNSLKINNLVNNVEYNLQNPNGFEKLQNGLKI